MTLRSFGIAAAAVLSSAPLAAQSPSNLLASGIRAYQNLDFVVAERVLARAAEHANASTDVRRKSLMYLGATEVLAKHGDSAATVFRTLVLEDPRYRADELVFPPQITSVFDSVRRATPAVAVDVPADTVVARGADVAITIYPSTLHRVTVTVQGPDSAANILLSGLVADSAEVRWQPPQPTTDSARFRIVARSLDLNGDVLRSVTVPVSVARASVDTTPLPAPPPDSAYLPERAHDTSGWRALAAGVGVGGALIALAPVVAPSSDLSPGRFAIGGAVSLAGIVGFFTHQPNRVLRANVRANEALRNAWRAKRDAVAADNAAARASVPLVIRAGSPVRREESGQ